MSLSSIKARLVAAGLPSYALVEADGPNGPVLCVSFDDLPEEGEKPRIDAAMKAIGFDLSDKGVVFTPSTPSAVDLAGFPIHAGNPVYLD